MRPKRAVAAIAAAVALAWGSAQAAPEAAEAIPEVPGVIILELQPLGPGEAAVGSTDQEQALLGLLLLQLLGAMQGQDNVGVDLDVHPVTPPIGTRI